MDTGSAWLCDPIHGCVVPDVGELHVAMAGHLDKYKNTKIQKSANTSTRRKATGSSLRAILLASFVETVLRSQLKIKDLIFARKISFYHEGKQSPRCTRSLQGLMFTYENEIESQSPENLAEFGG